MHRFATHRAEEWVRVVRNQALVRPRTFGRLVIVGLLMPYVFWLAFGYRYHFIDGVNLLIHEAGHLLLTPLGQTWHMLGGTLLQIAIPAVFCAHFLRRGDRFAGAVVGVWLAESLMNVGRYMGDAVSRQLPLFGGHIHDWNWILAKMGLLRHAEALGFMTHLLGASLALASVVFAWKYRDYVHPVIGVRAEDPEVEAQRGEKELREEREERGEPAGRPLSDALGGAWGGLEDADVGPVEPQGRVRQRRVLL
jgi:hypothetical protein